VLIVPYLMNKFPDSYIAARFISFWHWTVAETRWTQYSLTAHFSETHFNITLPSTCSSPKWHRLFSSDVFDAVMPHPSSFNLIIWRRLQIIKYLSMELSPFFSRVLSGPNILILSHTRIGCNWKCWMVCCRLRLGYGTRTGVRIPTEAKDFLFDKCPDRLWRPSGLLLSGSWRRPKREGRPFTSILCRV